MSRRTTNYGLTKPDYTDTADIEVVNSNMDIIDEALKVIDTKSNNVMSKNSSAWSSTVAYAVGQYCIYNNSLWKSLVQHSGQTPQEGTYWARVSLDTLGSEINALNSNMSFFGVSTLLDNWYGTHDVESTVTLVDSIDKYDLIIIACGFQGAGNPDGANKILPVSRVKKSAVGNPFVLGNCGKCYYKNNTTLGIVPLNNMYWDIYGVRFSNNQYN